VTATSLTHHTDRHTICQNTGANSWQQHVWPVTQTGTPFARTPCQIRDSNKFDPSHGPAHHLSEHWTKFVTATISIHLRTYTPFVGTLEQIHGGNLFDKCHKAIFKPTGPLVVNRLCTNWDLLFHYFGQQGYTVETCLLVAFVGIVFFFLLCYFLLCKISEYSNYCPPHHL